MPTPKTGGDLYLYYNAGTHASPTWTLVSQIEDLRINDWTWGEAELKRRSTPFVMVMKTVLRFSVSFKLWHGISATVFDALRTAALTKGDVKQWFIADGPAATNGTQGLRCAFAILSFPWDQSLGEVSSHEVVMKPTYFEETSAEVLPSWHTISGG